MSVDYYTVVLIKKNRPDWQRNLLNGVGGKVENDESPLDAIIREFKEETSVIVNNWTHFLSYEANNDIVYWFYSYHDEYLPIKSMTDETVTYYNRFDYHHQENSIIDINWIIPFGYVSKILSYNLPIYIKR